MGFFLRSLSAVYSLADCERLVNDSLDLIKQHQPTTLQTMLCTNDLKDVTKVIGGARVSLPAQYFILKAQIPSLQILTCKSAKRLAVVSCCQMFSIAW